MINKAAIDKMLQMPDEKLMPMLSLLLGSSGFELGDKKLDKKRMKKLRALLTEITDGDIERIMYLSKIYNSGV